MIRIHHWTCAECTYKFTTYKSDRHKVRCPLCRTDELPKRDYTEERGMTLKEWLAGFGVALLFVLALSLDSWLE